MSFRPAWASFILAISLLPVGACWGMEAQRADAASADAAKPIPLSIIPWPSRVTPGTGTFLISAQTQITADSASEPCARFLSEALQGATGFTLRVHPFKQGENPSGGLVFRVDPALERLGGEGYALNVDAACADIRAFKPAGLLYACQTLLQMLPVEIFSRTMVEGVAWKIPYARIEDAPRFEWRGLMLDCSRTFLTMDYLHRYVDLLATHKMNVLHLHLTDEQGWRIEIKKHPELTDIGAKWDEKYPNEVSGYYSQDQLRELVKYAADRFVTIIPEIEMPSHCLPVLKAHPELSCRGEAYRIVPYMDMMKPGVTPYGVMCAGNDATFALMEDVIAEVVDIFPSKYIHIGGDECPKEFWVSCPKCQARKQTEGLKDEYELQSYFVKRIEKIVNAHGRTLLGWDEILEGGLAPNAAVMSWRGVQGGITAAKAGHPVVMTPTTHCYFDYDYLTTPTEKVYAYEPIPPELTPEQGKRVLGAQASMWTHIARNEKAIDEQIFPRLCALAETVWSPPEGRNWDNFQARRGSRFQYRRTAHFGRRAARARPGSGTAQVGRSLRAPFTPSPPDRTARYGAYGSTPPKTSGCRSSSTMVHGPRRVPRYLSAEKNTSTHG